MFTKLLTIRGKEVVSAINPLAMINGNTIFSLKFKERTIARTIGVKINAAPSLAKKAATSVLQEPHPFPSHYVNVEGDFLRFLEPHQLNALTLYDKTEKHQVITTYDQLVLYQ